MFKKWYINRILIINTIFFSINLFAQDSTKTSRFSLGLNYAYEISYRSISPNEEGKKYPIVEDFTIPLLDSLQSSINAYSIGVGINYRLNKWLNIESGAYYSLKGHEMDEIWFFNEEGNAVDTGKIVTHYNFIDVPLGLNFNIQLNKLRFFLALGVSVNLFVANSTKFNGNTTSYETNSDGFPLVNYSINTGAGIDYHFHEKWYLRINPKYQRFLSNIERNFKYNYLNWNPYSYGVNVGVYYKF